MKLHKSERINEESFIRNNLYTILSVSNESELSPDPAIQQRLEKRLADYRSGHRRSWKVPANLLLAVLKFRVPIYQAAMGAAFLFVLMLNAGRPPLEGPGAHPGSQFAVQFADTTERLDSLDTNASHKIGRNLKEDSLLARFMTSIM